MRGRRPPTQVVPRKNVPAEPEPWVADETWLQTLLFLSQWRLRDVHRVYGRLLDQHRLLTKGHTHESDPFRSGSQWFVSLDDFRRIFGVEGKSSDCGAVGLSDGDARGPTTSSRRTIDAATVAETLFARFRRPNGDADVLEMFSALALLCATDGLRARVAFVFSLFAHVDREKMEALFTEQRELRAALKDALARLVAAERRAAADDGVGNAAGANDARAGD